MQSIIYSIVIPVYNTVYSLAELVERIHAVFSSSVGKGYEIIFIDDASPNPKTWPALRAIAQQYPQVQAVQLTRNFGQQAATLCGMQIARGNYIITMDDDLQHLPEEIPKLIAMKHHDIVVLEFHAKRHNFFKRITSRIKGWFDRILLGKPKQVHLSAFRLLNRKVVDGMLKIRTPYPFIPAMMLYVSKDIVGVPARHGKRKEGKSGYSLRKMIFLFNNLLFNNSAFLLKLIAYLGITIALFSMMFAVHLVFMRLYHQISITGWTSLIVSILFIGGLNLFTIGILGEYLLRIISSVESKPTYVIRQHIKYADPA